MGRDSCVQLCRKSVPLYQAVSQLMLSPTNARNAMTFLTIITFNQLQSKPLVCTASPLPPFLTVLQRNSLTFQATPGSDRGSTSTCLWLWSEGTPPAYWPVWKFDPISATLSALTSVPACHLPLFTE